MSETQQPQRTLLAQLLMQKPIVRAYELRSEGIDPKTISRAVAAGELIRISRGLYQRPDSDIDTHQALAEAAKKVPRGVVAMVSALAYHELTDQMPRKVWMAVSVKDWSPSASSYPPVRIVEFRDRYMQQGIEHHTISGTRVPIYSIPKTLADVFRNRKLVDRSVAVEALRATLDQRRATPASIAEAAMAGDAWNIMRPYLEALTSNG
ncbi:type IV toxin-antitoxin system AbiEi family antitoxin domain-containing protein [Sphingomonas flavalba]|uniref:AbiEi antitoxin N-terminal domain-containing protein n=1 Tax=Sphingobium nicotianae TaxID=2782607 RepID=A0A9X1ITM1_9SPHN|nr:AbiEi antitoxin N-terminal domain-containing protein [Sphingobium nicotianae]MBT2189447.1 AbiEi antitoxin N-terminal domain-containing protein [Sphingobium nicotianae]